MAMLITEPVKFLNSQKSWRRETALKFQVLLEPRYGSKAMKFPFKVAFRAIENILSGRS